MKIRNGFVSNSSSSSFLISFKDGAYEILKSANGTEIKFGIDDLLDEIRKRYEIHSDSTILEAEGTASVWNYIQDKYCDDTVKEMKEFIDKYPEENKALIQIEYGDKFIKKALLNLIHIGLVHVLADEYDLRDE